MDSQLSLHVRASRHRTTVEKRGAQSMAFRRTQLFLRLCRQVDICCIVIPGAFTGPRKKESPGHCYFPLWTTRSSIYVFQVM